LNLPRLVVLILGAVYVLVGILGFVDGLVTGEAPADMPSADGLLLGIFPINALHNIVHLVIGAALLYGATSTAAAIMVARVVGVTYLVVGVLGFVAPDTFGLMPIGGPDIALHLGTAAVLLAVGFLAPEARGRSDRL
jgi:hypothetical protein